MSAKHRLKFAAQAVTGNGDSRRIAEKLLRWLRINKQNTVIQLTLFYFSPPTLFFNTDR
jgi:hypothetical protein